MRIIQFHGTHSRNYKGQTNEKNQPKTKVLHQIYVIKHSGKTELTFDHDQFSEALEQSVRLISQAQRAIIF